MSTMKFCRECSNLLYPKENIALKKLEYACKLCNYTETNVNNSCVRLHEVVKESSTSLDVIPSELNKDPTLQRSRDVECAECGHNEAVFFQAEQTKRSTALRLIFICCSCGYKWEG
mmetsp:Transcript_15943/g.24024  ORF Transcript_15943/g.24024 Transcript_15943/m.24024 type:complete len:116 (+) Transcript_15943:74-421(+)